MIFGWGKSDKSPDHTLHPDDVDRIKREGRLSKARGEYYPGRCPACFKPQNRDLSEVKTAREFFCSDECYTIAIDQIISPQFRSFATFYDSDTYKDIIVPYWSDEDLSGRKRKEREARLRAYVQQYFEDKQKRVKEKDGDLYFKLDQERTEYQKQEKEKDEKRKREDEQAQSRIRKAETAVHEAEINALFLQAKIAERQRKAWEDDYDQAHKENDKLLELEAFEESLEPRPIPEHIRIHTAIIAKTGWGKTQLLQHLTVQELRKPDPPSLVILDSTGAMVERLQKLAVFNERLRDRLLIIDPAHSPALNMFDVSNPRFNTYTAEQKESTQADLINLFNYIFSSKDYDLSGQQGLGFIYAVRLILTRSGYTVTDLRHLLEEAPKTWEQSAFADDIRRLDQDAREFFQHHFYSDSLKATKAAIARRLHALIAIPTFRRMFTAGSNVLDLYSETQDKGSIILVNTNQHLLGRDGYVLFGRYVVARTMAAMLERANIPQNLRRSTHLLVDEAAPYFDDSFDDLLTQVRQYGLKVTVAFQHLDQLDDKLRNAVAGQTSVKYIGGMSPLDERRIAAQIRCDPEFISNLALDISYPPQWSEWAVYADGFTKHPMKLQLPFYTLENEPRMSDEQHAAIVARNIARVAPKSDKSPQQSSIPLEESPAELRDTIGPDVNLSHATPAPPKPSLPIDDPHTGEHSEPAPKWGS